jgi:translation initiation factor IF-1
MDKNNNNNSNQPAIDPEVVTGVVMEALPNTHFKVQIGEEEKLSYLAGKMRLHRIRVMVGDRVELLLDSYGGKARIVRRL